MVNNIRCTQCGAVGLEPGFVGDLGQGSRGFTQWVAGALEKGLLGNAKLMGRPRWQIDAYRCPHCGHLEHFATQRS
ncbi:hypothetical protein ACFV1C_26425 [Streptomyces sp. NPDC059605]|uniref:hypothetical protein n=1 Tax=unclassified Streptomyces TaxID=2593676 RepID=UPI0036B3BB5B